MPIPLPEPLLAYFDEENRPGPGSVTKQFTADATVLDEGQTYCGWDAIKAWKQAAKAKYHYTVEPLAHSQHGETVKVTARLAGNFPGSPVELTHSFILAGGKIASLEIHG